MAPASRAPPERLVSVPPRAKRWLAVSQQQCRNAIRGLERGVNPGFHGIGLERMRTEHGQGTTAEPPRRSVRHDEAVLATERLHDG